jgi:hypothetical protein
VARSSATSQPGSAGLPCDGAQTRRSVPGGGHGRRWGGVSTRFLILAALVCGVAILAASAIQILMAR